MIQNRKHYSCATRSGLPADVWSFCIYIISLRDFVTEWHSRPSTTTEVNSPQGEPEWRRHGIWWWYQVNKCRTRRGNRSELAPVRKSPWCHVNTPLRWGETRATPDWKECLKYLVECKTTLELALTVKIRKRLTIKCMQLQIYYCAHSWNIFNTWKEISHLR